MSGSRGGSIECFPVYFPSSGKSISQLGDGRFKQGSAVRARQRPALLDILKEMEWYGTSFSVPTAGQTLKNCLWMNNRPQDYIARYSEKNYILHDPVVTEFRRNFHPYSWSDIRIKRDLKKTEKAIIDEAREWGARDGFMVPIVTQSGSISGFCPCGFEPNLSPPPARRLRSSPSIRITR